MLNIEITQQHIKRIKLITSIILLRGEANE